MITFNQKALDDDQDYYVGVGRARDGEGGAVLRKSTNTGDSFKSSTSLIGETTEGAGGTPKAGGIRVTTLATDKLQDAANISLDQMSSQQISTESHRKKIPSVIGSHRSGHLGKEAIQIQGDRVKLLGSIMENARENSLTPPVDVENGSAELKADDDSVQKVPLSTEDKKEEPAKSAQGSSEEQKAATNPEN